MKGIYYVSNCVKVYKDALNSYYSGNFEYNPEWRNELESISNRSYTEVSTMESRKRISKL